MNPSLCPYCGRDFLEKRPDDVAGLLKKHLRGAVCGPGGWQLRFDDGNEICVGDYCNGCQHDRIRKHFEVPVPVNP